MYNKTINIKIMDVLCILNHYIKIMDVLCIMNHYINIMDVLCIMNHYIKNMDVLCIINHYINLLDLHLCGNTFFWEKYICVGQNLLEWHLRGKTFFGESTFFWCTLPLRLAPSRQNFFLEKVPFFGVHYHHINILITVKFINRISRSGPGPWPPKPN